MIVGMEEVITTAANPAEEFFEPIWRDLVNFLNPSLLLQRVVFSAILVIIAIVSIKLIFRFFKGLRKRSKKFTPIIEQILRKITKVSIWTLCIIAVLQTFGINLTPIIAGLGVTGVVLGFALQESISSFFSGLLLAINNPFRIGDYVEINGIGGTVDSIDLMCITLNTPDNKRITMSNKSVWGNTIINYSYITNRRVDMVVPVSYDADLEKVRRVIWDIIRSYPEVQPSPEPVVEVNALADSSINFIVRPWVAPGDYWKVYWRFQHDIVMACRKNNIEIPYNKLDVTILNTDVSERKE